MGAGLIDEPQLSQALASQRTSSRRLGEELVHLGYLSEVQMTQVLSNQLSIPWVSLYHVEFSRDLLNLVPAELAEDFVLIPVYVRRVRNEGEVLFVAMDDPTSEELLGRIRDTTQMVVKPMVAPPSEIKKAIQIYYFGNRPRPESNVETTLQLTEPAPPRRSLKPDTVRIVERGTLDPHAARTRPAPPPEELASSANGKGARGESLAPSAVTTNGESDPPAPARPSTVTLTLLDGTKVSLPAPRHDVPAATEAAATASDLIAALRARSAGGESPELPADATWESLFAALLSVLIRKGLVADWEFVEELARRDRSGN